MQLSTRPDAHRLGDALDFLRLLWGIQHRLKSASKQMERRIGLTGPQRLVLRVIEELPDISPTELAEIVQLDPSTLSGVIRRLRDRRLIDMARDRSDERRILLRIRSAASSLTARGEGTIEWTVQQALRAAPAGQVKITKQLLRTILEALDDRMETSS